MVYMVYGIYNYSYWGESKPTNITGGPYIVVFLPKKHHQIQSQKASGAAGNGRS